jgi:uncharacterized protein
MKGLFFSLLVQIFAVSIASAASYDCTKATFTVEKVVCGNPSLSTLDDQLAQAYKNARATSANLDQLKNDQIAWIKSNRLCEANVACIENSYKSRITALGGAVTPKAAELPKPAPTKVLPSTQPPAGSNNSTNNWVQGIEYYYVTNPEIHGRCKMEKNKCITFEEYKSACINAIGVTRLGSGSVAMSGGIYNLFRNGSIDRLDVIWNSNYRDFPCRVVMEVSGIVDGNSRRRDTNAKVEGFILNENNKILVHAANSYPN